MGISVAAISFIVDCQLSFLVGNKHRCFCVEGVKYWSFHDRDISPEGTSLEESNAMLDEMTDFALQLQQQTGIKLLWNTCNLFAHPRYYFNLEIQFNKTE